MTKRTAKTNRRESITASRTNGHRPAGLFTWVAVSLVVLVIVVLVIVKIAGSSSTPLVRSSFQPTSAVIVHEIEHVPTSIFNSVGVDSPVAAVTPPLAVKRQPELTEIVNGKKLPEILYVGGEYCPFCAAQRWSTILALSRFGTFSGLGDMSSYAGDEFPNTPTFTFVHATYTSPYVAFSSVEEYANYLNKAGTSYATLQRLTKAESREVAKYDTATYFKGLSASNHFPIPFMSFANRFLVSGASYSPATLQGATRQEVAAGLALADNPITRAIVASANYQTAAICSLAMERPNAVCESRGVLEAQHAMAK